jgi:hypothetical protein
MGFGVLEKKKKVPFQRSKLQMRREKPQQMAH